MEEFGIAQVDPQKGFGSDRGTIDGLFTRFVVLHKRKEHGLETWALFIVLVKAVDTVPREVLFVVLWLQFSRPFCQYCALITVKTGEDNSEVKNSFCVRQRSCEGPILLLPIVQAAMKNLSWPVDKLFFTPAQTLIS